MREMLLLLSFNCLTILPQAVSAMKRCINSDSFYFNVQPKSIQVKEGGRAFLECNVSNRCSIHFHWTLNDRIVVNTTRRYQNGSNLIINRVNRSEDFGDFHCIATWKTIARESRPAQLSILWLNENVSVVVDYPSSEEIANSGQSDKLQLKCEAFGSDQLHYTWFYNGRKVKRSNKGYEVKMQWLTVRKPSSADNGVYACTAENLAGSVHSSVNFALKIPAEAIGSPMISVVPQDRVAAVGDRVRFDCRYENATEVRWRRVSPSKTLGQFARQLSNGSLLIDQVTEGDEGWFECVAFSAPPLAGTKPASSQKQYQAYSARLILAYLEPFSESSFAPIRRVYAVGNGKRLEVACSPPSGFPQPIVFWTRNNQPLPTYGRVRSEGVQLVIDEAGGADGGQYSCVAENGAARRQAVLTVILTGPPKLLRHPASKQPLQHQNVHFNCRVEAAAYPATVIEWEKNGELLTHSAESDRDGRIQWNGKNGTLSIERVTETDEGQYRCIVKTADQAVVRSKMATLTVRKRLRFNPRPVDRKFELGNHYTITCSATGEIEPKIKWMQTKKVDIRGEVTEEYRPPRTDFLPNVRPRDGTLYFRQVTFDNAGVYLCAAVSKQGIIQQQIRVEVFVYPTYMKSPMNKTVSENTDVYYDCVATGTPNPTISWYFEGISLDEDKTATKRPFTNYVIYPNNTLHLHKINISHAGKYACLAGNRGSLKRVEAVLCVHLKKTNYTHCGRHLGLNPLGFTNYKEGRTDSEERKEQNLSKTMAIACGVAGSYILLVISLLIYCGYRRRRSSYKAPSTNGPLSRDGCSANGRVTDPLIGDVSMNGGEHHHQHQRVHNLSSVVEQGQQSLSLAPLSGQSPRSATSAGHSSERFVHFSRERLDPQSKHLGSGVFGRVYLAKAYGIRKDEPFSFVLIKAMTCKDDSAKQLLDEELNMLSKSNHGNVIRLMGVCRGMDPLLFMYEYMDFGDLKTYMVCSRRPDGPRPLEEHQLISIAYQVAQGMEHISDQRFVHKDLAARNVLIGPCADSAKTQQKNCQSNEQLQNFAVKIGSLSLQEDTFMREYHTYRNQSLPVRWMSPETLADDDYSMKSDVWAYGVFLWEIFSCGEMPYCLLSNDDVIRGVIQNRIQLETEQERVEETPDTVVDLIQACCQQDPRQRPTFTDIRDETGQMHVETGF